MNRILTIFIALHWTVVFAALTALAGLDGGENFPAVLAAIGISFSLYSPPMPAALCALLAIGFGTVAALFLWTLVTALFDRGGDDGDADEVARLAFGSAVAVFTLVFLGYALTPAASGLYRAMAVETAALLASYLAVCAESRMTDATKGRAAERLEAAARTMALRAAHESLVHRLMGRRSGEPR